MQNRKGIYMLISFVSIILIFFFVLFFFHERTLENGILFKISFQYENAQNITYNFYNQSGKIEKIEISDNYENSYLLQKTEYNTVRLLRKIIKNRKELKQPSHDEGITIYNEQNKRYYLLPFDTPEASELSTLIIDGYIHSEINRINNKQATDELYIYKDSEEKIKWTNDGSQKKIIDTYQCEINDCKYIYLNDVDSEAIIFDKVNYIYNYNNKTKEVINTSEPITNVTLIKNESQLLGVVLYNDKNYSAFYNINTKEVMTPFENQQFSEINQNLLLNTKKQKIENNIKYLLSVIDLDNKEEVWNKEIIDKEGINYKIADYDINEKKYYILSRKENTKLTYQLLNDSGKYLLDEKSYSEILFDQENIITIDESNKYELYDLEGNFIKKGDSREELIKN